ncbi:MAG: hypothetical protein ACREK7_01445 [Gemmatimonadota bacterium]
MTDLRRPPTEREALAIRAAVARLRTWIVAVAMGTMGGLILFLATVWLLIRGGENVGATLGLLSNYFPGYSVTWPGAFVGLAYGVLAGGAAGGAMAWIYNRIAHRS